MGITGAMGATAAAGKILAALAIEEVKDGSSMVS